MSKVIKKTDSPMKKDSSASKGKPNLAEMFEFFARIVKLVIIRKDDTDGKKNDE